MTVSNDVRRGAQQVAQKTAQAARKVAPWIAWTAHLGYAAKGLVYAAMGLFAVRVALGHHGTPTDSRGVLATAATKPFGTVALIVAAVGFAGYAVWRFVAAATDAEGHGGDAKGMAKRAAFAATGLVYAGFAAASVRLLVGAYRSRGNAAQHWTGEAMRLPGGPWLVGAVGLGILAYGGYQLYVAAKGKLDKRLDLSRLGAGARRALVAVARFGIAARAVVFGIIGAFLVKAAAEYDPGKAKNVGGALRTLQQSGQGPWLLGIVAAGLVAYGAYLMTEAGFRRIRVA